MTEMLMNGKMSIMVTYAIGGKEAFPVGQWTMELINSRIVASKFKDGARTHMVVFSEDATVTVYRECEEKSD